jgi:hypothetical protein
VLSLIGDETLPDSASTSAQPPADSAAAPAASATPPAPEIDLLGGFSESEEANSSTPAIPAEYLIGTPRPVLAWCSTVFLGGVLIGCEDQA